MRRCGCLVAVLCGTFLFWYNLYWAAMWWGAKGALCAIPLCPFHVAAAPFLHYMMGGLGAATVAATGIWMLALVGAVLGEK